MKAHPLKMLLEDRNLRATARHLAARYGTDEASELRQLERIRLGDTSNVHPTTADRIAIGLGMHPALIWPDW